MTWLLVVLLALAAAAIVVVDRRSAYAPVAAAGLPAVRWTIARVEGRRLVRHPLVWIGLAVGLLGFPYTTEDWAVRWGLSGIYLAGSAWGAFVVVHLAVSRDRRSGTDELADSLPAGPSGRVVGHLLSLLWVIVPITVIWVAFLAWRLGVPPRMRIEEGAGVAYVWQPSAIELAQGPVMLGAVLLMAVAAGVWWRHPIVGVVVPLLLFFSPVVWLVPLVVNHGPYVPHLGSIVEQVHWQHTAWHHLFLTGLGGLGVATAFLRRGSRRVWLAVALLSTTALLVGFVQQQHPWWLA